MNEDRIAYVNGEFVLEKDAVISIRDRGFLQGYSVFDTTRTFGHKIFKLCRKLILPIKGIGTKDGHP